MDFISRSGTRTLRIDAQRVASLLNESGIRFVVTNACRTAQAIGDTSGNFAQTLVSHGIAQVLGMSFELSVRAAEIYMEAFYTALLKLQVWCKRASSTSSTGPVEGSASRDS